MVQPQQKPVLQSMLWSDISLNDMRSIPFIEQSIIFFAASLGILQSRLRDINTPAVMADNSEVLCHNIPSHAYNSSRFL